METWAEAMQRSLYGPAGYYLRGTQGPGFDYRTSTTASPVFAAAIARLIAQVNELLGFPEVFDFVEVGAADGRLLMLLKDHVPHNVGITGVDLAPRPQHLSDTIGWSAEIPEVIGLLFANEWLDNVPLDVMDGEMLGGPDGPVRLPSREQLAWLAQWGGPDIGLTRDNAWAQAVSKLQRGVAVTADYCTTITDREATLTGYRDGRQTEPRADGHTDITAHVAIDSAAAAAGADHTSIRTQRQVLQNLGLTGKRPHGDHDLLQRLQQMSAEAELIDPHGLGGFLWLAQAKGCPLPASMMDT